MERIDPGWIFPAGAMSIENSICRNQVDRSLQGESLGGNRWTIIELVSHLVRAVARERGRTSAESRAAEADKSAFEIPIRSCPPRYEL